MEGMKQLGSGGYRPGEEVEAGEDYAGVKLGDISVRTPQPRVRAQLQGRTRESYHWL